MKFNSPILKIAKREYHRVVERKTLFVLSIVLPVFIFLLFTMLYKNEIVRDLPMGILDLDNSSTSKMITRFIESSSYMKIENYYNSIEEVKQAMREGKIQGAVSYPPKMEKDLKLGKPTHVTIYKNTANIVVGNLILRDASTIVKTVSGGALLKKFKSKGLHPEQAYNIVSPIKIETKSLYNSHYSYLFYLVPGLLACLLQMIIMLSGVLIISSEFVHNTFDELADLAEHKVHNIIIGKSIPHLFFHLVSVILIIGVLFPIYNIKIMGSPFSLMIIFMLFVMASFFLSFLISSMFHDQLFATELALMLNTPAFLFSGFTFPLTAMPLLHNIFANIIPFTHFLYAFLMVYQMGTPLLYASKYLLVLLIFIIGSLILTSIILRKHLNKLTTKMAVN